MPFFANLNKMLDRFSIEVNWSRLFVVGLVAFGVWRYFFAPPKCLEGNLSKIEKCKSQRYGAGWKSAGYWYTRAQGPVAEDYCARFRPGGKWVDELNIEVVDPEWHMQLWKRRPCEQVTGKPAGHCYATRYSSQDGSIRFHHFMIFDAVCNRGEFFYGSNMTLQGGAETLDTGYGIDD